jgi:hypothetical protein
MEHQMKKLLIPLYIALITGCASTAETAKSVGSSVADAGKATVGKVADAGKSAAATVTPSNEKPNMKAVMKHVSPMPNLMPIAIGNADLLDLKKEQTEALAKGREERHDKVHGLANEIIADEKAITQAALEGKSKDEINKMSEAVMEKRLGLIDAKASCRDTMRKVLNEEQWNEVIKIAKENQT